MADVNNIIRLADFPRKKDPVVEACKRRDAAAEQEDCEAYMLAESDIARLPAATPAGALVKYEHIWTYFEALMEGDTLTAQGEATVRALHQSILTALGGFAARAAG